MFRLFLGQPFFKFKNGSAKPVALCRYRTGTILHYERHWGFDLAQRLGFRFSFPVSINDPACWQRPQVSEEKGIWLAFFHLGMS